MHRQASQVEATGVFRLIFSSVAHRQSQSVGKQCEAVIGPQVVVKIYWVALSYGEWCFAGILDGNLVSARAPASLWMLLT